MGIKKTTLQFKEEVKGKINPHIEIIGEYCGSKTKIKCRCKMCGSEFYSLPYNISRGHGCNVCEHIEGFKKRRKSSEDFLREVEKMSLNFEILEEYYNAKTKLKCRCNVCKFEWYSSPDNILQGRKCPKCAVGKIKSKQAMTKNEFVAKLSKINSQIEVVGKYINNATQIECRCLDCGNTFFIIPRNLLTRTTCPICTVSKGENTITKWLQEENIKFESQKTFDNLIGTGGGKLRYDFYLPDFQMLIEYNGIQHKKPVDFGSRGKQFAEHQYELQKQNDELKRQYANNNDLKMLEIWYYDFDKIGKILESEVRKK